MAASQGEWCSKLERMDWWVSPWHELSSIVDMQSIHGIIKPKFFLPMQKPFSITTCIHILISKTTPTKFPSSALHSSRMGCKPHHHSQILTPIQSCKLYHNANEPPLATTRFVWGLLLRFLPDFLFDFDRDRLLERLSFLVVPGLVSVSSFIASCFERATAASSSSTSRPWASILRRFRLSSWAIRLPRSSSIWSPSFSS